jgi:hypothetical protein
MSQTGGSTSQPAHLGHKVRTPVFLFIAIQQDRNYNF